MSEIQCGSFAYQCTEEVLIHCPPERAYEALHRIAEWPRHLPHVRGIEVLYDDGTYQEFMMTVDSNGRPINVRSVRRCEPHRSIGFFQPECPAFLRHHGGSWEFQPVEPDRCKVITQHRWNLNPGVAQEMFPPTADATTEERVASLLQEHARLALTTWKQVLEAPAAGSEE